MEACDTIKLPESVAHAIGETEFGRVLTWRDGVLMVGGNKAAYYFSRRNGIWTFRDVLRPQSLSPGSVFPVALRYERGDADIAGSPQLHGVGTLLATNSPPLAVRAECTSFICPRRASRSCMPASCSHPTAGSATTSVPTSA